MKVQKICKIGDAYLLNLDLLNNLIKNKKENKLVCAWKQMPKKKKIILIVILSLIIILVVGLILFFALHKEQTGPSVILQEDNYRYENGKLVFLNKDKNEIGTYECEHKDENLCYVAYYKDEDNLDIDVYKNEDDSSYLKRSLIYKDNFVFITDTSDNKNTNVKLYNIKTNSVDYFSKKPFFALLSYPQAILLQKAMESEDCAILYFC